ncbi:MAG: universal stress protein [Deltaproteobacteria bacterium]|nr:universal stress protein [Deltaproteobacteria bacterium]
MVFRHVIAGLDLSPRTQRVASFAASLSRQLAAELVLVHADPEEAERLRSLPSWAAIEVAMAAVRERAGAAVGAATQDAGAALLHRVGSPEAVLQTEAETRGAAVVVVGSGATGTTPDVGVTTTRCLRTMTLPLMIVPTHRTDEPAPVRKILAPVDLDAGTAEALALAGELARALQAELVAAHVVRPPLLGGLLGSEEHEADVPGAVRDMLVAAGVRLDEEVAAAEVDDVDTRVVSAVRAADGISALADELGADLVILPAHGRGAVARFFLGSTSERLVRMSNVPVLVLPPTWVAGLR